MQILYNGEYIQIRFDESQDLITIIRKASTEHLSEEEFKHDSLVWAKFVQEKKPSKMLVDGRDFKFIIKPELQLWLNKNLILPAVEAGLKKFVYVVPDELFVTLSLEQSLSLDNSYLADYRVFTSIEKAKIWLGIID